MTRAATMPTVDQYRAHLAMRLVECDVPPHLHEGLIEYLVARRPVGGFLTAVLSNNLLEAYTRADDVSRARLFSVVSFLLNFAPSTCWGSPARVQAWLDDHREPPMVFE